MRNNEENYNINIVFLKGVSYSYVYWRKKENLCDSPLISDKIMAKAEYKMTKGKKRLITFISILIGILVLIYLAGIFYFQNHFLPGTKINGIETEYKTAEEAKSEIASEASVYSITLEETGDATETISGTDIDFAVEFNNEVEKILAAQKITIWPLAFFSETETELSGSVVFDEDKLAKKVDQLSCMDESKWTHAENPTLGNYIEGSGYEILPAAYGSAIQKDTFLQKLTEAIYGLKDQFSLFENECYEAPLYATDSEQALAMKESADAYGATHISYSFGDDTEVIDGNVIKNWLKIGDDLSVSLDADQVKAYIAELAEKYDTYGKGVSFVTSYNKTITLPSKKYGWEIDQEKSTDKLIEQIEAGETYEGQVSFNHKADGWGENELGDTYVEVNVTAQHVHYYKDGKLIIDSDCVTGNPSLKHETDLGIYHLQSKSLAAVLKGTDYASPVGYWMPFNHGEGLHDATWRTKFGGTIYKTSGSHGCVNLPLSVAKTIYENIEVGCPIVVYELEGTETTATSSWTHDYDENKEKAKTKAAAMKQASEAEAIAAEAASAGAATDVNTEEAAATQTQESQTQTEATPAESQSQTTDAATE